MEVKSVLKRFLAKEAEENLYLKIFQRAGKNQDIFVAMSDNPKSSAVKQRKTDNAMGKYCPKNIIQKMLCHRLKSQRNMTFIMFDSGSDRVALSYCLLFGQLYPVLTALKCRYI